VHYEEFGSGVPLINLHGRPAEHGQMVATMEPLFVRVRARAMPGVLSADYDFLSRIDAGVIPPGSGGVRF